MRSIVLLLFTTLLGLLTISAYGQGQADASKPLIAPKPWKQILPEMTNDELFATLARAERARYLLQEFNETLKLDPVLLEVRRRAERSDGDRVVTRLHEFVRDQSREIETLAQQLYVNDTANLSQAEYIALSDTLYFHTVTFASTLTMLRRIEKKPDPVYMEIVSILMKDDDEPSSRTEWTVLEQPDRVRVRFMNRDDEFERVFMYVDTCTSNWRVYAASRSPAGPLPQATVPMWVFESCRGNPVELSRGEDKYFVDEEEQIEELQDVYLNAFARFSAPGTYRLQIQYHPREALDDHPHLEHVDDTVCLCSSVINFILKPTPIEVTSADIAEVVTLIDQIDVTQPIFLIEDWYEDEYLKYIPPDSAAGRILAREFKSIPGLLQALERKNLTLELRSWVLGLLDNVLRNVDSIPAMSDFSFDDSIPDIDDILHYRYRLVSSINRSATYKLQRSTVDELQQKQLADEWIQYLKRNTKITIVDADE